ncbi:hypothetical protein WUBG_12340 [Wuchereria bancrofti]|nr:hypothetical protein WUBG_12340 [Wuchereria bancrofti]
MQKRFPKHSSSFNHFQKNSNFIKNFPDTNIPISSKPIEPTNISYETTRLPTIHAMKHTEHFWAYMPSSKDDHEKAENALVSFQPSYQIKEVGLSLKLTNEFKEDDLSCCFYDSASKALEVPLVFRIKCSVRKCAAFATLTVLISG